MPEFRPNISAIKTELDRMVCQVHGEHIKASIEGQSISISGCCPEFAKKVTGKYEELITQQAADFTVSAITNAFR